MRKPKLKTNHRKTKPKVPKKHQRGGTPKRTRKQMAIRIPQPGTHNGRVIRDMMLAQGIVGNYKDYVVIAGKVLMDWACSYNMVKDGETQGLKGMALIHKSIIWRYIGDELAAKFWNKKLGMRCQPDKETRDRLKEVEASSEDDS